MKYNQYTLLLATLCWASVASAAPKPCEELKAEIAAKLAAKGVSNYQLSIMAVSAEVDGQVVGQCDAGQQKIVYKRLPAQVAPSAS